MRQLVFFLILVWMLPGYTNDQIQRYRGSYTFGHEVNIFCPEINSQCYWLSPSTEIQIRQQLQQLSKKHTIKPYQAVCVVIQGNIDRESRRDGFAANYAGLIEIVKVFGICGQPEMVTQGDLQHHRWTFESINGVNIAVAEADKKTFHLDSGGQTKKPANTSANVLYLEFVDQMTVFANTGCNKLTGQANLREDYISFNINNSDVFNCSAKQQKVDLLLGNVLASEPTITIDSEKNLLLESAGTLLKYRLKDWVR